MKKKKVPDQIKSYKKLRKSWDINPKTRVVKSKKKYSRKRQRKIEHES